MQPEGTRKYFYIDRGVPEQNLALGWTELPGSHSTLGGSEKKNSAFRERNDRNTDRKAPSSHWSRGRTGQLISLRNLTIALSVPFAAIGLHSVLYPSPDAALWDGVAAASSHLPLFSQVNLFNLVSFLLLHSFWGEQTFSLLQTKIWAGVMGQICMWGGCRVEPVNKFLVQLLIT